MAARIRAHERRPRRHRLKDGARPLYNYVDDCIQGVPIPYGNTTILQFQNLDEAELYGVDASGRDDLGAHLSLRTALSYVCGPVRFPPLSLRALEKGLDPFSRDWEKGPVRGRPSESTKGAPSVTIPA